MRYLYTLLLYLAVPFIMLRLLWRSRSIKGYRHRWHERFGHIPTLPGNKNIWIHAVSVGEAITAIPLIKALQQQHPQYTILVTTTTPTGSEQVLKHLKNQVVHVYAPYDLPSIINRFLDRCNPTLCIIMETELWPNLLHAIHQRNIPILLANARLSEPSFRNYQRITKLTRQMLANLTWVAAQSDVDGERFTKLGLDHQKLTITGNIKFDLELPDTLLDDGKTLRAHWGDRPTLIAASTHEGEEAIILQAFKTIQQKYPNALLILVPRHPDRFEKVAKLCQSTGFSIVRRSLNQLPDKNTDILLGDTLGELRLFYTASDIAFVGGSLVPVGGHNLIEPAAVRLPIVTGNYLHNFTAISQLLKNADAALFVDDAASLSNAVIQLLDDRVHSQVMGERAYQVSAANSGALAKHLQWIDNNLGNAL